MKKEILPSLIMSIFCLLFFSGVYTLIVWGIAQLAPNKGEGFKIQTSLNGKYYYENIGQSFTQDQYFWSRPSAVNYNAAGSGGSNKGPANPDYLAQVQQRIDTFMAHNPGVKRSDIPSDLVTASGSGLDPHISVQAALVQIPRIARTRQLSENTLKGLIGSCTEKPLYHAFGPERINVLKLNLELNNVK